MSRGSGTKAVDEYLTSVRAHLRAENATEHTFRPALQQLLEALATRNVTVTNEPRQVACGAPDFVVSKQGAPVGYLEAKDIGAHLDKVEQTEQLHRYLEALPNLILTDYLEFRWYKDGEYVQSARLARLTPDGKLKAEPGGAEAFAALYGAFLDAGVPTVNTPKELAARLAGVGKLLRDAIVKALETDDEEAGSLHQQMAGFKKVLLHDLEETAFADMYAQTVCYGLFAAACNHKAAAGPFTRQAAVFELPETNPFLRETFHYMAGPNLDPTIAWAVDQIAALLDLSDIGAILKDFGRRTRQEDPVVHFYETFLHAYDPSLRETRGVYYTPEPVVSFIVRSVDAILKRDFGIQDGLSSTETVRIPSFEAGDKEYHKVLLLDPAAGTGTFLHGVVDHIHQHLTQAGQAGAWQSYVSRHLLPRLFGFELLMAPYAVAHMKLGLQLRQLGYEFQRGERLGVYLTNSLEQAFERTGLILPFGQIIAEEASAAGRIKTDAPVMVVLGNPPYSGHSENKGEWIHWLMRGRDATATVRESEDAELKDWVPTHNYFQVDGKPLGERNPKWLNDDYVKFIRFAQWRIEQTGHGVLAFISNHSYLNNPTFRGMRHCLLNAFDDIYLLDLHGNTKRKETAPDGSKDDNVFDIQQGVAIGIFVKRQTRGKPRKRTRVYHADLWGPREIWQEDNHGERELSGGKYRYLQDHSIDNVEWKTLKPSSPHYLFTPWDTTLDTEYGSCWNLKDIFRVNSVGTLTARDKLTVQWSQKDMWQTVTKFASLDTETARYTYDLGSDAEDWKVSFAQADVSESGPDKNYLAPIMYRPFDKRWTYFTGRSRGFICRPRTDVMKHMRSGDNIALDVCKYVVSPKWMHVFATSHITDDCYVSNKTKERGYIFPLYLHNGNGLHSDSSGEQSEIDGPGLPNFTEAFVKFWRDGNGPDARELVPEQILAYIYAILHSPGYRSRYGEHLKRDFPHVPFTAKKDLFDELQALGARLISLHLSDADIPRNTRFPASGSNTVEKVWYVEPQQRVYINGVQYFEGVSRDIWEFHVGGYQVCQKWLNDRKNRQLTYDDIQTYQYIVAALGETQRLMQEIDQTIDAHGGWPIE